MHMDFDMQIDEFDTPYELCEDCPSLDASDPGYYDECEDDSFDPFEDCYILEPDEPHMYPDDVIEYWAD